MPGVAVNQTFANFQASTSAFKNSVIKAITGAQMSEPEARRIMQQIPMETDKPEGWQAKYESTKRNLAYLQARVPAGAGGATPTAPVSTKPAHRVGRFMVEEEAP